MSSRLVVAVLVLCGFAGSAHAQRAQLQLDDEPHVGMPFVLGLVAEGFDEAPTPDTPKLEIAGATVTPLPPQPNVSTSIQIVNGRRSDSKRVTWVFRWRIEIGKAGRVSVPPLTIVQGGKKATSQGGNFDVQTVPTTDDMKLELALPDRPVFVGETIDVKLTWLFRRQPHQDPQFSVPMMGSEDFTVSAPPVTDPRRALTFQAGTKELQLPYELDQTDTPAGKFNRVTVHFLAAPKRAGKVEVPGASVSAAFAVGRADFFGNAPTKLFRAADVPHTFEVKPLPETDKPPGFAGAVGSQFSIAVGTSRSVVQLGEPVELAITVKSEQRLDTLSLPKLDGPGGLPKDKFTVPPDPPTGELSDDGKTKKFKVTAQVTGPATEIPALAFSYFDPVKGRYQTIHSDPIALSVKGGSVVGAGDVVAIAPKRGGGGDAPADTELALVGGVELALSAPGAVDDRPMSGTPLWLLVGALYAIPLLVLGGRSWQLRTAGQREEAAEVRAARRRVEDELARAGKDPARETAGSLVSALRAFARTLERDPTDDGGLFATIETEGFAPSAARGPLSPDLRVRAEELVERWTREAKQSRAPRRTATAAALMLVWLAPRAADAASLAPNGDAGRPLVAQAEPPAPGSAVAPVASSGPARAGAATDAPPRPVSSSATSSGPARAGAATDAPPRPVSSSATSPAAALAEGRAAYQEAMASTDASARKLAFARAATLLGEAARTVSDRPELLTDWGNAALGAGDVATATLAYRRALALDGDNARARRNLAWLRNRQAAGLRPAGSSAADALFFFHSWPRARRAVVGGLAFAVAVLLLVPWTGRRRRALTGLAVLPAAVWIAMLVSLLTEDRRADDAVVMDAVVLRAADSAGAPAALTQPLPRGAEVTVVERRDAWTKVRLAGGTAGWVPAGAVERISR